MTRFIQPVALAVLALAPATAHATTPVPTLVAQLTGNDVLAGQRAAEEALARSGVAIQEGKHIYRRAAAPASATSVSRREALNLALDAEGPATQSRITLSEDVGSLRALVEARLCVLPSGFDLPDPYREVPPEERQALLDGFLASPEGTRRQGDEAAEDVAALAIVFGADYNHGGPLRWSPVVVELFMLDWLARKVTREPGLFERVPDVLRDWVRYAVRRRGVPEDMLREAVDAVAHFEREMLETATSPPPGAPRRRSPPPRSAPAST